jgi:RNA polymerase sigma-70 factor (sigma-E family)
MMGTTTMRTAARPWRSRLRVATADDGFAAAVAQHSTDLARFAYLVCGDRAQAEDAVAEALARAWPRWRRGEVHDLLPYVRRAVVHELYSRSRRRKLERREEQLRRPPGPDGRFEDAVGQEQSLWPYVARLPLAHRMVVVLRIVEDRSEAETADLLGVPPGTVKSRLSRALTTLRTMMEEDGHA